MIQICTEASSAPFEWRTCLAYGKTAPWRPHCRHGHCLCPCHPQARAFFPLCPLLLRRGGG